MKSLRPKATSKKSSEPNKKKACLTEKEINQKILELEKE